MKFFQFEYMLDVCILLVNMSYLVIILRDWRYGTFLQDMSKEETAQIFWKQYSESPVNEHVLLLTIAILLWMKAFSQMKYLEFTGQLYQLMGLLFRELVTFVVYYVMVLFLYTIIGMVLFKDMAEFYSFRAGMFHLFKTSVFKGQFHIHDTSMVEDYLFAVYFISYLVLNVILLMNLIVAQLVYAFRKYND
jgi:hypothetical protein